MARGVRRKRYAGIEEYMSGNVKYLSDFPEISRWLAPGQEASKISHGSSVPCNWVCAYCGSEFSKSPNHVYTQYKRNQQFNLCGNCNRKGVREDNSLYGNYKTLCDRFYNFEKNQAVGISIDSLAVNSNKKIFLKCPEHGPIEKPMRVADFVKGQNLCRRCTSLIALFPSIAKMVDIDTYNTLDKRKYPKPFDPWEISAYSHKPLPFLCDYCGDIHFKPVAHMVNQSTGCPHLCARNHDSMPQLILHKLLKTVIPDLKYKYIFNFNGRKRELDIYSNRLRVAIEYDGYKHDKNRLRVDNEKSEYCLKNNIFLIRVREDSAADLDKSLCKVIICRYDNNYKYLVDVLAQISAILQERFWISSDYNYGDILSARQNAVPVRILKDSFIRKYPVFRRLLHSDDKLKAERIRPKSSLLRLNCTCLRCHHTFSKTPKKLVEQKGRCPKCGWFIKNITDKNSPLAPPLKNWAPRKIGGKRYGSIN